MKTNKTQRYKKFMVLSSLCLLITLAFSGCGTLRTITSYTTETAEKISNETNENISKSLDKAIKSLDTNSADWQTTLKQLEMDLNGGAAERIDQIAKEGQKTVQITSDEAGKRIEQASEEAKKRIDQISEESRKRLQQMALETNFLMSRGIAQTGTELRCNADFVGKRMQQRLKELKDKILLKKGDVTLNPAFCQVVPDVLDLRISAENRPANIQFYGYDFFDDRAQANRNSPLIRVTTRNSKGQQTSDLSHLMALTTHYLLTFKIAEFKPDTLCASKDQKIVVETLNGTSLGELNIVCPLAPTPTPPPTPTPRPTPTSTPIPPADLVVAEWNINNLSPIAGEQVTARARVQNIGSGPAGKFQIRWTHNAGNGNIQERAIDGLAPGSEIWVDFNPISYPAPGAAQTSISVDSTDMVREADEGNNNSNLIQVNIRPITPKYLSVVASTVELFHYDHDNLSSDDSTLCRPVFNAGNIQYYPTPQKAVWSASCSADSDGYTKLSLTVTANTDGSARIDGVIEDDTDGGGRRTTNFSFTVTSSPGDFGYYRVDDGTGGYAHTKFFGIRILR